MDDQMRGMMSLGYSERIKALVAEMMRDEFADEETFVDRASDVMTAMVSELANCAAALVVQKGAIPDAVASIIGEQFGKFYRERLDTLQGHGENVTVN